LLRQSIDNVDLNLLVDSEEQAEIFRNEILNWKVPSGHSITVRDPLEVDEAASSAFSRLPNLIRFRNGHPCWRKITDAALLTREEAIIIDPDVYFLRRFRFDPTPKNQLLLMWQPRNCLFPFNAVDSMFQAGVPLADNTDIGIAQIHDTMDWDWIDGIVAKLDLESNRSFMHVESIVWAAIAIKKGGNFLSPHRWTCYAESSKRRLGKLFGLQIPHDLLHLNLEVSNAIHLGGSAGSAKRDLDILKKASSSSVPGRTPMCNERLNFKTYKYSKFFLKKTTVKFLSLLGLKVG
jgi:hypothetical protein